MGQTYQDDTSTELSRPGKPGLTTRMVEKGIQQTNIFLNPTLVSAQEFVISRSGLGKCSAFPPGSVVDWVRTNIQHIYFLAVDSLDDCVSMNCMECSFPTVCYHDRLYFVRILGGSFVME